MNSKIDLWAKFKFLKRFINVYVGTSADYGLTNKPRADFILITEIYDDTRRFGDGKSFVRSVECELSINIVGDKINGFGEIPSKVEATFKRHNINFKKFGAFYDAKEDLTKIVYTFNQIYV